MTSRGAEKMNNDTIGVDVSKDHLDAHRLADGATRRFANDKGGHKALIKWLAETPRRNPTKQRQVGGLRAQNVRRPGWNTAEQEARARQVL